MLWVRASTENGLKAHVNNETHRHAWFYILSISVFDHRVVSGLVREKNDAKIIYIKTHWNITVHEF